MVEAWQPATELEGRMRDALDSGDDEAYYGLLAEAELVIPVAPELVDEVLTNRAQPTWPTQEHDGRTHVLVFTSPEAMQATLGPTVEHFILLKLGEIADTWPQPQWWLSVNTGLPVQGLVPAWFVRQIADGDARPPRAGLPARSDALRVPDVPPGRATAEVPVVQSPPPGVAAPPMPGGGTEPVAQAAPVGPSPAVDGPAEPVRHPDGPSPAVGFRPANDVERALLRADAESDEDTFIKTLIGAEVLILVPEQTDPTRRPGRPGFPWQISEADGERTIALFTSQERMLEFLGEDTKPGTGGAPDFMKFPFRSVIRYWPDRECSLLLNSGTLVGKSFAGERLLGIAEWADRTAAQRMSERFEPQNDVERRLYDATTRRDTETFFKVLRNAQVLMPADPETPWGIQPGDPGFPWRPLTIQGENSIQIFTSLKWMHDAIGPSRFIMPSFLDVVSSWPDPEWTLVLNPGSPIDAAVSGDQVAALRPTAASEPAAAPVEPVVEPEAMSAAPGEPAAAAQTGPQQPPLPEFEPGNRIDQELYEAAVNGDTDTFLQVLLSADVLVPVPADAPLDRTPMDPHFQWKAALRDPSAVQVFTSLVQLHATLGGAPGANPAGPEPRFVYIDFRDLIDSWPHAEWTMLLNPGTRIGASLRGDQVQALSEWALRVGLIRRADSAATDGRPPEPRPAETPAPHAPAVDAHGRPIAAAPYEAVRRSPVMQKVLPHGHVTWYLDQGYDRVGGFVHLSSDVGDLQTPAQLYEVLGLLTADSSFSPDDDGVYVIRWTAHCDDLYRIPFGGQTEEDRQVWGDAGWIVERAPFHGDGFAPGSFGTIREFKVDSVRLPHGAEMYYLGRDRSERFVAVYDPDVLTWLRQEDEADTARDERTEAPQ